jgi:hypothetical protein
MELWEMTFKQYREFLLESNKYKKSYEEKPQLWEDKKKDHFKNWEKILLERAEIGLIPSDVIMSYTRETSEGELFRKFRGIKDKGIANFRIPKIVRELRKKN